MDVSILLTEDQLETDLIAHLRAGRIPEKYFYWSPLSAKAWLALCRSSAYRNYERSMSLIAREAEALAGLAAGASCWIGLGCGQADKDLLVLRALARGRAAHAVPAFLGVDSSLWLLERALAAAAEEGIPARGVKADIERATDLTAAVDLAGGAARGAAVFALLGNTLGAIDYREFLSNLEPLLRRDDLALVDGEIYDADSVAGGYLNEDNRRFAVAPLRTIGLTEADGELIFELRPDPGGLAGLHLLHKHFEVARDLVLTVGGEEIPLARGSRLDMGHSCKYTPVAFTSLLERTGGLTVERTFTSDDGRFLLAAARRHRV
ncbi:MAG TPA: L-histidine N(alpha)-methyltransferase [Candidatus Polarisedimenticolia bacterium]